MTSKLKRILWLAQSADLSVSESLLVVVNKIIFAVSRGFYFLKNIFLGRDPKAFYGYARRLAKNVKPKGRCLLAFLVDPIYKEHFLGNVKFYFSNNGAPLCVLRALNELGYIVDVIDYKYTDFIPRRSYDLFFFHQYEIYDALKPKLGDIPAIEFETTAYWQPMVERIRSRLAYFKQRHKIELPEEEYNHFLWMEKQKETVDRVSKAADGLIVMGDQLAESFKLLANSNIRLIKSAVYQDKGFGKDLGLENLDRGRNKFLFFGGGRDVMRKGVDILLEAFIGSEFELYMCIGLTPLFEKLYNISAQKNIHNLGYLKVGSEKFYEIINSCDFIIQPAAAEGVPGGVLETMKYGLIPIVSKESNIPEAQEVGYLLPDFKVETVKSAVSEMSALPTESLRQKALAAIQTIETLYTPRKFIDDIKKSVLEILSARKPS